MYTNIVEYSLQENKHNVGSISTCANVYILNQHMSCHAANNIFLAISPFSTTFVPVTLHFSAVLVLPTGRTTNATAPGIVPHRRTEEELLDLQRRAVLADGEISLLILGCPWKIVTS